MPSRGSPGADEPPALAWGILAWGFSKPGPPSGCRNGSQTHLPGCFEASMGEFTKSVFGSVNLSQQGYGWILDPAVSPAVSMLEAQARCRCLRVCISPICARHVPHVYTRCCACCGCSWWIPNQKPDFSTSTARVAQSKAPRSPAAGLPGWRRHLINCRCSGHTLPLLHPALPEFAMVTTFPGNSLHTSV